MKMQRKCPLTEIKPYVKNYLSRKGISKKALTSCLHGDQLFKNLILKKNGGKYINDV